MSAGRCICAPLTRRSRITAPRAISFSRTISTPTRAEGERARAAVAKEIIATKTREFDTLGVVLGSRYTGSPIIASDGSAPPAEHFSNFQPSAHPGCLAPHAWLDDGSSLYDHFGLGYTLLLLSDTTTLLAQEIEDAAVDVGIPFTLLDLRGTGLDKLYAAPLALIRPDQFVAWRGIRVDVAMLIHKISGQNIGGDESIRAQNLNQRLGRVAS